MHNIYKILKLSYSISVYVYKIQGKNNYLHAWTSPLSNQLNSRVGRLSIDGFSCDCEIIISSEELGQQYEHGHHAEKYRQHS